MPFFVLIEAPLRGARDLLAAAEAADQSEQAAMLRQQIADNPHEEDRVTQVYSSSVEQLRKRYFHDTPKSRSPLRPTSCVLREENDTMGVPRIELFFHVLRKPNSKGSRNNIATDLLSMYMEHYTVPDRVAYGTAAVLFADLNGDFTEHFLLRLRRKLPAQPYVKRLLPESGYWYGELEPTLKRRKCLTHLKELQERLEETTWDATIDFADEILQRLSDDQYDWVHSEDGLLTCVVVERQTVGLVARLRGLLALSKSTITVHGQENTPQIGKVTLTFRLNVN